MDPDIFTEPDPIDPDTLRHLGPLAPLAGVWEGRGVDTHPVAEGTEDSEYLERIELQPIDPQPNGPQLLYGLRYHQHITEPGDPATFHDQVGYWLWEPATGALVQSLAIPRAQVALAGGTAAPDARRFTVRATRGATGFGICSGPFLERAFTTVEYSITVTVNADGTFAYEQETVLQVAGRPEPFRHLDRCTLRRVAPPTPNPLAPTVGRR
jgi:hypothetical protein